MPEMEPVRFINTCNRCKTQWAGDHHCSKVAKNKYEPDFPEFDKGRVLWAQGNGPFIELNSAEAIQAQLQIEALARRDGRSFLQKALEFIGLA